MKRWTVKSGDKNISKALSSQTGLSLFITDILSSRGITTKELAKTFIDGGELSDPYLLEDMVNAVSTIRKAVSANDKIAVYGDYDCDGITATVLLYTYLDAVGAEVMWYIPSRDEGYGLNKDALSLLKAKNVKLIITVDNGITAVDEINFAYSLGLKVVVTDHHKPMQALPKCEAVIDPHRADDTSPCKCLAGVGVVLKLIAAMENGDYTGVMEQYSDIAAIGTIGDIVPITGENRIIVKRGLETLPFTENVGLDQLMKKSGINQDNLTSTAVSFGIVPRINAAGRFGHPNTAAELLLCESVELARSKSEQLYLLNKDRQNCVEEIMTEIDEIIFENPVIVNQPVIIIAKENWHHGVIGIVAAKVTENFGKPAIIFSIDSDTAVGSARSIAGFSIYDAVSSCSDLLVRFGGHMGAAGLTIKTENISQFNSRIQKYALKNYEHMPVSCHEADLILSANSLTVENLDDMENLLAPFGEGNPTPVFLLKNCVIISKTKLKDGKYTMASFELDGKRFEALFFYVRYDDFIYDKGDTVDMIANIDINEYNDKRKISIKAKDIRPSDFNQDRYFNAKNVFEQIMRGEKIDKALIPRVVPSIALIRKIYDLLRNEKNIEHIILKHKDINYCMLRVAIEILEEFELLKFSQSTNKAELLPPKGKVNLEESVLLKKLMNQQ